MTGVALLVVASCTSGDGPAETTAERAPVRSTTTTAPPRPTLEQVAAAPGVLAAPGDQRMVAVASDVEGATGFAVGTADGGAAAWRATAVDAWERVSPDASVVPAGARFADVASAPGGGFVLVGDVGGVAAVWMVDAGGGWRAAFVDAGPPIAHVARTGIGLVAFAVGEQPAVWRSLDGATWVRAVDGAAGALDRFGLERVAGVADVGRGVVALVERADGGPELWSSSDGFAWSVAPGRGDDLLPADGAASVHGLAQRSDGTIVAGGAAAAADGVDAAAWASAGGRVWEAAPHDENELGGDGAQVMASLVADGQGRVVAIGTDAGSGAAADVDLAVWTSADGLGWLRADPEGLRRPGRQHAVDVAVLDGTVVAVGWESVDAGDDAAVWRIAMAPGEADEPEGAAIPAWVRIEADALGGPGEQRLEGLAVADGGYVAVGAVRPPVDGEEAPGAVGSTAPPVGSSDGAVWLSPDGREWVRADDAAMAGEGDQQALAVASGPRGLVAVGGDGDDAAVWSSADGRSWRRRAEGAALGGTGRQVAVDVVALASGYVAVGRDEASAEGDAAVWVSLDARGWRRLDGLDAGGSQAMHAVAVVGERVMAVGRDGDEAVVWVTDDLESWSRSSLGPATVHGIESFEGAAVAVGSVADADGRLQAAAWRLSGERWERATGGGLEGAGNQAAQSVALGGDLAIAVGRTDRGGGGDAASWTSTDAGTWSRTAHDENVLGGDGEQRMTGVVVDGPTAIAVGWSGSSTEARDAAVWVADQVDVSGAGRNL